MADEKDLLIVRGARQHNLHNVSVSIPKNKLVVFTGMSGSGKSSLAFDTIYAEGQRRYVESLSAYARQFLGMMAKPDVDAIIGLSPAIAIDQKSTSQNPRSTVGTITEVYDYLRLLFARVGHPHCPVCGAEINSQSAQQIIEAVYQQILDWATAAPVTRYLLLAPLIRGRKGEFKGLLDNLRKQGFKRVRINRTVYGLDEPITLSKTSQQTIDAVIDRITLERRLAKTPATAADLHNRLREAVETGLKLADGLIVLSRLDDHSLTFPDKPQRFTDFLYSQRFACPRDNVSLAEIQPRLFSFNSPHGACPACNGLGSNLKIDPQLLIAPDLSLAEGAVIPYAAAMGHDTWFRRTVATLLDRSGHSLKDPFKHLPAPVQDALLWGTRQPLKVHGPNRYGRETVITNRFEGFIPNLERRYRETDSEYIRAEISRFMRKETCPTCHGRRLKPEALSVTIAGRNIWEITDLPIDRVLDWVKQLSAQLSPRESQIAAAISKELTSRLRFLAAVGLTYLTLNREAATLAGGEAQRIRLASQIGSGLSGVLYVLDEPTIGLHQRDNLRLIKTLKHLRDLGNTVIVVEHDRETIEQADYLIDFGPLAGKQGGRIIAQGTVSQICANPESLTGKYLTGKKSIGLTAGPAASQHHPGLTLSGCRQHNLHNITVTFPLNKLICVTGVSGSGKSTLVHDTLYWALVERLHPRRRLLERPGIYADLSGTSSVTRVNLITQKPIGRTPRSNPVTYTKTFDWIRQVFAATSAAKVNGYGAGRFSFNIKGGRCEACQGGGEVKIEMQFLPDVYVTCDVCQGRRYNSQTLEITYKDKTIADVLGLTVDEALTFFAATPQITRKLQTLQAVGLGYLELGQPSPQLSGGEAQRIKLAKELSVKSPGHTVYLLDEPTTGLHFADLQKLLAVLKALVAHNNTVIVVEHNLDIIKNADWIIDLGPEGGSGGGRVVAVGPPRSIAAAAKSHTGLYLKKLL